MKHVLRLVGGGVYRWITPAIWDALALVVERKGTKIFSKIADLLLGNKYSSKFRETVGNMVGNMNDDPPKVEGVLEAYSELSKQVLDNAPSRESSSRMLDAISMIMEHYPPGELKEKGGKSCGKHSLNVDQGWR